MTANNPDPVEAVAKAMFDNAQRRRFKAEDADPAERWEDQVCSRKKPWLSDAEVAIAALAVKGRGDLHTAIMDALNKAILAEHPGAFHEESESDIVIPANDAIAYVQISTSQLAEVILPIVEPLRLTAQPAESGAKCYECATDLTGPICLACNPLASTAPPAPDAVERATVLHPEDATPAMIEAALDVFERADDDEVATAHNVWHAMNSARAKAAEIPAVPGSVGELRYAQQVATYAAKRVGCIPEWRPLDDVMGCLSQIDNALTGLSAIPPRIVKNKP